MSAAAAAASRAAGMQLESLGAADGQPAAAAGFANPFLAYCGTSQPLDYTIIDQLETGWAAGTGPQQPRLPGPLAAQGWTCPHDGKVSVPGPMPGTFDAQQQHPQHQLGGPSFDMSVPVATAKHCGPTIDELERCHSNTSTVISVPVQFTQQGVGPRSDAQQFRRLSVGASAGTSADHLAPFSGSQPTTQQIFTAANSQQQLPVLPHLQASWQPYGQLLPPQYNAPPMQHASTTQPVAPYPTAANPSAMQPMGLNSFPFTAHLPFSMPPLFGAPPLPPASRLATQLQFGNEAVALPLAAMLQQPLFAPEYAADAVPTVLAPPMPATPHKPRAPPQPWCVSRGVPDPTLRRPACRNLMSDFDTAALWGPAAAQCPSDVHSLQQPASCVQQRPRQPQAHSFAQPMAAARLRAQLASSSAARTPPRPHVEPPSTRRSQLAAADDYESSDDSMFDNYAADSPGAASAASEQQRAKSLRSSLVVPARRGRKAGCYDHITVDWLAAGGYLDMPIQDAAKQLNMGLSVLKRVCREVGLVRWPYRKRASMQHVISKTRRFLGEEHKAAVLASLETTMQQLTGCGEVLDDATRSYRQSIFKLNHKMSRLGSQARRSSSSRLMTISKAAAAKLAQPSPSPLPETSGPVGHSAAAAASDSLCVAACASARDARTDAWVFGTLASDVMSP